jgi:hypothetical protein
LFEVGGFFMLLSFGLASPFMVFREVRDESDRIIYDSSGEPLLEFDRFGNFMAHWRENGSFLIGTVVIGIGVLVLVATLCRSRSRRRTVTTD